MDEFQKEEEFLFEENEENIVIKYKLLRSLIINRRVRHIINENANILKLQRSFAQHFS